LPSEDLDLVDEIRGVSRPAHLMGATTYAAMAAHYASTSRARQRRAGDASVSTTRLRWGWRRAAKGLRREGSEDHNKRVQRLWREEGLRGPYRKRKNRHARRPGDAGHAAADHQRTLVHHPSLSTRGTPGST
jgi:hypothetical protein